MNSALSNTSSRFGLAPIYASHNSTFVASALSMTRLAEEITDCQI